MTGAESTTYAVDDEVVVTGYCKWHGHQIHDRTGTVARVTGEGMPRPLYQVDLDGFAVEVPLTADELAPLGEEDACRD